MHSCIYEGQVRHRRFEPKTHHFDYKMFMMYLDLDELPSLFDRFLLWSSSRPNIAYFNRSKHHGPHTQSLADAIRDLVEESTGSRPIGPIRLLTHLSYFGYGFNPVSFYYCFDESDEHLETVVAEVNNTPWGEQHCYVLSDSMNTGTVNRKIYHFDKAFHVSPFMPMHMAYQWYFSTPSGQLNVHMKNMKDSEKHFDATLKLKSKPITSLSLARLLVVYPLMTAKVIVAIHYQALRLWIKRIPLHTHPDKLQPPISVKKP